MSQDITPKQLQKWLEEDQVTLIDVRRPDEFAREYIPQAINIPQEAITHGVLSAINADKVVLYCNTGNRSSDARERVNQNEAAKAYNLAGGIENWKQRGGRTKQGQAVSLPLQRQV